jgi:hypothetical protein
MPRTAKPKEKASTVKRRIFFCRLDAGVEENGRPRTVDLTLALTYINTLSFSPEGRYLSNSLDDRDLCCWLDKSATPFHLRVANIRRGDFPPMEKGGELTPLLLQEGGGLAEQTHFVIFANGIVGCEYSHFGPRHSSLGYYLQSKAGEFTPAFRLSALVRRDIQDQLERFQDVRLIQFKVQSSFISVIEEADADLGAALRASAKAILAEDTDQIELVLQRKKRKGRAFWNAVIPVVKKLAREPDLREQVSKFRIGGISSSPQGLVDVLSEQISIEKQIQRITSGSAAVNNDAAYGAIETAYGELEADLLRALEIAPL